MTPRAGDLRPRSKVVTRTSATSRRNNSTYTTSKPSQKCPSCSAAVLLPQSPCPNCSALLPLPSNLSHHSILFLSNPVASSSASASLDISQELANTPANGYDIDKAALKKNWLLRQRDLHPDKYQAKDDGEKSVSLARELSGRVNEAYNVLKDDLKRADYILSLHSRETEETDKIDDPMMLAEILEAREELEEASSQDEVDRIRADNHEKVVETTSRLSQAFAQNSPDLHEAKNLAIQLRYWRGLEDAAKDKVI
ncbi:Fe-S protein assembly co-chaperone HscB [Kwoniella heveanensis BCC8398]|uniref:Fe-S protein assembly co-chaperone HscB n=1 Tax=Kwoniella heveanensis BCC8398 TaxID=1296120 RepID=A0A1B9H4L8_9TREE|nr:Fe-S protein assembly co-chaperone HscB [Kwoniella heveanensis BCC8398]